MKRNQYSEFEYSSIVILIPVNSGNFFRNRKIIYTFDEDVSPQSKVFLFIFQKFYYIY